MRALVALLFLACASSDGLVQNAIEGGAGQDIAVGIVDVDQPLLTTDQEGTREYTVHFEITNMTRAPLTVSRISIRPSPIDQPFRVQESTRSFNEMIDGGAEHVFKMPLRGRLVGGFQPEQRRVVEFQVIVSLTNGDSYFYTFEGPVRDVRI